MQISEKQGAVIAEDVQDFDLAQTLECGQCFHFQKLDDRDYVLSAFGRMLHVRQQGSRIELMNTRRLEYETVWKHYFDLERDYGKIKNDLLCKDPKLSEAVQMMQGVRILNQDFFETLISFILSQNKQIPHIKQLVAALSKRYGKFLGEVQGEAIYAFPDCSALTGVSEEALRDCKTGFRAPYICDAVRRVSAGEISAERLRGLPMADCRAQLMQIRGVGTKVANCVMLFGLGRRAAFPVDVWIKRIMETLYFAGETVQAGRIEEFAAQRYGSYGGYAQQYLFYYGKTLQLGMRPARSKSKVKKV